MFAIEWEEEFFFAENLSGKSECLICGRVVATKRYNIERHYRSIHKDYGNVEGDKRIEVLLSLKKPFYENMVAEYQREKSMTTVASCSNAQNAGKNKSTYLVALELAKHCRPFTDAIFFKNLSASVLECFGEEAKKFSQIISSLPLSNQTMHRRTEEISSFLYNKLKHNILNCKYYAICLDETTDLNDLSQLLVFVKTVDKDFNVTEEVGALCTLHGNVTGMAIFNAVNKKLFSFSNLKKLSSVCTDGAPVMVGKKEGFVGQLMKNNVNVPCFHCIIHQQALFSKAIGMMQAMKVAVKIINKIRGGHNSLRHRKFVSFLKDLDADYGDLLLYTEVRWLSRGKSLERLFNLRKEVVEFLMEEDSFDSGELLDFLKNPKFLLDLAFLCDMTSYINQLNFSLQGKNKSIIDLVQNVTQFQQRLEILNEQLQLENFTNMPKTNELVQEFTILDRKPQFSDTLKTLKQMYEERFHDFRTIKDTISLFNAPLTCNILDQDTELHEELYRMRCDISLPLSTGIEFWQQIREESYPKTKDAIYRIYSMFGSTYSCEVAFSTLKNILSKHRNRLSDSHLESLIRIKCCPYEINIDEVIKYGNN